MRDDDEVDYKITTMLPTDCKVVWMKVGVLEVDRPAHRIAVQVTVMMMVM